MKRKNLYATLYNLALLLLLVPASLCMTSCSDEVTSSTSNANDEEEEISLNVTFEDKSVNDITRAIKAPVNDIYLYAYQGKTRKAYDVRYTYVNGAWVPYSTKVTWPTKDALFSLYGLTDSYQTIALDSMKYRFIHYDIDPDAPHDVYYGSTVNTNKTKSKGNVNMNFTRLVSRVHFACKNSMEDGMVRINKIEVHNLVRRGKFTYSETTAGAGSWALLDYWGTYSKSFTAVDVPAKTNKKQVTDPDDSFILIPQSTVDSKWTTTDANPVTLEYADAHHQIYLAVYCQVFKQDTQTGDWDVCVWGAEDFKPIYIPLAKTWSKSNSATTVVFDIGKGFKADGTTWEPDEGNEITFSESMLLESELDDSDNIDPWEDDDTPHVINL